MITKKGFIFLSNTNHQQNTLPLIKQLAIDFLLLLFIKGPCVTILEMIISMMYTPAKTL